LSQTFRLRRRGGHRPGADLMKLNFGRKVFGQILITEFPTKFHSKLVHNNVSHNNNISTEK
jgi:hypothetical protein